jgi:gliding motility-associated-like protein
MFFRKLILLLSLVFVNNLLVAQFSIPKLATSEIQIKHNGKDTSTINKDTVIVKICFGDSVILSPKLTFVDPIISASQLKYEWIIGGIGFYQKDTIVFKPKYSNGYYVTLNIYKDTIVNDVFYSWKLDSTLCRIQVSAVPQYLAFKSVPNNICMDKVVDIYMPKKDGTHEDDPIFLAKGLYSIGGLYKANTPIPDIQGQVFESKILIDDFGNNAVIKSKDDIQQVCMSMEHSYLGDLEIVLTCPTGKSAVIINSFKTSNPGTIPGGFDGKDTKLGNDLDMTGVDQHGDPHMQYCFSTTNSTYGTMGDEYLVQNFKTNIIGMPAMNPDGIYIPEESFNNFIGCPIKGNWTITISDNNEGDDGYIFDWGIMFNSKAFPKIENYQNTLKKSEWVLDEKGAITNNSQDTTFITPKILGANSYKYTVMTDYGCTGVGYDTTIHINTKLCLNIPNVMSLSSKVGNNIFYINTGDVKEFKCEIFNRWGSVMSTLSGQKDGWDGRDKFGRIVDEGVYFYKLNITFNNGTSISQDGNFLLMH